MYIIDYHNDVEKDFKDLGNRVTILALKKIEKLLENPIMGDKLGNKANLNLTGLRKVFVVAVGKRDDIEVYKTASSRISNA